MSSASLIHSSRATPKPSSPTATPSATSTSRQKPDNAAVASNASLNYHIPTPDATGLVKSADFAALYEQHKYHEPVGYVRYSETVEESCAGTGGLGYCMDEEDEKWLTTFNSKAEGGSGSGGGSGAGEGASSAPVAVNSPLRETSGHNQPPNSTGRERRQKGKDKEREKEAPPSALFISEDLFEYVMGMLEKYTEDTVPMLHTVSFYLSSRHRLVEGEQSVLTGIPGPIALTDLFRHRTPVFVPRVDRLLPRLRGAQGPARQQDSYSYGAQHLPPLETTP